MNGERDEEEEEETVIPFPDAVVHPWAMMVEFLFIQIRESHFL